MFFLNKLFSGRATVIFDLVILPLCSASPQEKNIKYVFDDSVVVYAEKDYKISKFNSIAAKTWVPLFQTPASVGVVTRAMLQNQNSTVLGDALNNISGVNVQTGLGIFDYFIIRGFNSLDNGLILTDGITEPEVTIYNLYNIDRVEVLKGPGAFLYGGNPLSGTINLVRKTPVFRNHLNFYGYGGSFNSYRYNFDIGLADSKHGLAARLNGLWQKSDFYRDNKKNDVYAINPAISWQIDNSTRLSLNFEYLNSRFKPDAGLPLVADPISFEMNKMADVSRDVSFQTPFDESEQKLTRVRIGFSKVISSNLIIQNKFYYTDLDWFTKGTILNGAFPDTVGIYSVSRSLQKLDDRQKLMGNQFELLFSFGSGFIKHSASAGFEINRLEDKFDITIVLQLPPIDLNNPIEMFRENSLPFYPYQSGDGVSSVLAPYLLDVISFGEKSKLFLGGRYDIISFEDDLNESDRDYKKLSPMLGINYSLFPDLVVYANTGKAFAPPSSRVVGNPKAEESLQFEAGVKKNWLGGKIRSTIAVYQLTKDNIAITDRTGLGKQTGSKQSRGIEIEFAGQMDERCASLFSYTYTDTKLTEFTEMVDMGMGPMFFDWSNNRGAFAPKHIVNFWHTREIGSGLGIGAGFRYVSEQFIHQDNIFSIESYFTIDVSLFYRIGKYGWNFSLKNLTNTEYEMRGFGANSVIPAAPIAFYGGFTIEY